MTVSIDKREDIILNKKMITGRHDFVTLFSGNGETGFFNYMYNGIVNSSAIEIIAFLLVVGGA